MLDCPHGAPRVKRNYMERYFFNLKSTAHSVFFVLFFFFIQETLLQYWRHVRPRVTRADLSFSLSPLKLFHPHSRILELTVRDPAEFFHPQFRFSSFNLFPVVGRTVWKEDHLIRSFSLFIFVCSTNSYVQCLSSWLKTVELVKGISNRRLTQSITFGRALLLIG